MSGWEGTVSQFVKICHFYAFQLLTQLLHLLNCLIFYVCSSNGAGVDLNRDFPLVFPTSEEEYHYSHHNLQPETAAVMRWSLANNFVLSLSLLSGQAMLVLPFDDRLDLMTSQAHETPDNDIFTRLADKYVAAVGGQAGSWNCANLRRNFPKGWVNGAEWYPARGTMMDWSYVRAATPEITVGLHCCRNPGDEATLLQIAARHERVSKKIIGGK